VHPLVALMRRFAVDWLDRADAGVCAEIMDPAYTVLIGGATLAGRDETYVPATLGQLDRFPGLLLTVHELMTDGERVALRFTEHGPSAADGGQPAAWTGIGLFSWDGERLTRNVTEEDYLSRRRQLAERHCDPIGPPAAAPWAELPVPPDAAAESAVRAWLERGDLAPAVLDEGTAGPPLLDVARVEVDELFSTGRRVAFHAVQEGRYRGGLPGTDGAEGRPARLGLAGLVAVDDVGGVSGRVVRDRAGLRRALRATATPA
jgi:hypothetical protein